MRAGCVWLIAVYCDRERLTPPGRIAQLMKSAGIIYLEPAQRDLMVPSTSGVKPVLFSDCHND